MKKIIALLLCLLLSACASGDSPVQLPVQSAPIHEGQSVLIHLNAGDLTVRGGEEGQVSVAGQTLSPDQTEYSVATVNDQIQIVVNYTGRRSSGPPVHLEISVPNNAALTIETNSASIAVRDYSGELEAASVSGDVLIEDAQGGITARSNRGDVTVKNSAGIISVVGNYGLLTLDGVNGDIGVSTIMGTINFTGLIHAGDNVRLETDHGPVDVNLEADSTLTLNAQSTSGDMACMLPDINSSTRWCDGQVGTGEGALQIRTVSGAVWIRTMP